VEYKKAPRRPQNTSISRQTNHAEQSPT